MEVIEWYQKKEEAKNGAMLDMERPRHEEKSNMKLLYPALHIRELGHGTWSLRDLLFITSCLGEAVNLMLGHGEFGHLT